MLCVKDITLRVYISPPVDYRGKREEKRIVLCLEIDLIYDTVLPEKVRVQGEVPPLNYIRVLRSAIEQRGHSRVAYWMTE